MTDVDAMPQGGAFVIGEALFAALEADASLSGAVIFNNPKRASDLSKGDRIVFIEDVSDSPGDNANRRTYRYNLGVVNRTAAARQGAHRDYRAAARALRRALPPLRATLQVNGHKEGEVVFRLENIDVGGGLVLATFTLNYSDPSPVTGPVSKSIVSE